MRCGCSNTCGCVVTGDPGIKVAGQGAANNPYRVGVKLSTDAGNQAEFGTDQGLYVSGAGDGGGSGGATVRGLPAAPNVLGGFRGAGWLIAPDNQVRSFGAAFRLGLHLATVDVTALLDNALVTTSATNTAKIATGQPYTQNPVITNHTEPEWRRLVLDIGNVPGNPFDGSPVPQEGWFGFCEPPAHGGPFLDQVLDQVGNRIVLAVSMNNPGRAAGPLMLAVQRFGVQESVIVTSEDVATLQPFIDATVATGVLIPTEQAATANPPQSIVDAGVGWVFINQELPDSTVSGYVQAGLQVMMQRVDRQMQRPRVEALGARGVVSSDPVYYSAEPGRYQDPQHVSDFSRKAIHYGWLSPLTDAGELSDEVGLMSWKARGFYRGLDGAEEKGWTIPGQTDQSAPGVDAAGYAILQGYLCPTPEAGYRLTFTTSFNVAPNSSNWSGVLFACPDDRAFKDYLPDADDQGYLARIWGGGMMQLSRQDGATDTVLAEVDVGTFNPDIWYEFHVEVTVSGLAMWWQGAPETSRITSTDTTWRGGFVHAGKRDGNNSLEVSFREIGWAPIAV